MTIKATGLNRLGLKDQVQLETRRVVVTSAEILALNATPVTLIPAQGTDTVVEFVSAVFHKPAGTAYADIAGGDDFAIKYTNGSGAQVNTSLEATGFMDQTTAQTRITRPIVTEYTPVENAALVLQMLNSEITTGDSPLVVTVHFRVFKNIKNQSTR